MPPAYILYRLFGVWRWRFGTAEVSASAVVQLARDFELLEQLFTPEVPDDGDSIPRSEPSFRKLNPFPLGRPAAYEDTRIGRATSNLRMGRLLTDIANKPLEEWTVRFHQTAGRRLYWLEPATFDETQEGDDTHEET